MLTTVETPPADAADLTFPRYWRRWQNDGGFTAVVARDGETTRGMALLAPAFEHDGQRLRRLLSIAVRRGFRRQGVATALMAAAEATARAAGIARLTATYSSRLRTAAAVRSLVERAGWTSPTVYQHRLAGRADWVFEAAATHDGFLRSLARRGYGHQSWRDIGGDDHACVAAMVADGTVPAGYQPPAWPEAQQSPYSLALRKEGRLVGWIFGELQGDGRTVLYHTAWVRPPFQKLGWLVGGLIEVCRRQSELLGGDSVAVHCADPASAMLAVMERRLLPHGPLWMDTRLRTEKALGDGIGAQPAASM